jgi:hypothetical protein
VSGCPTIPPSFGSFSPRDVFGEVSVLDPSSPLPPIGEVGGGSCCMSPFYYNQDIVVIYIFIVFINIAFQEL